MPRAVMPTLGRRHPNGGRALELPAADGARRGDRLLLGALALAIAAIWIGVPLRALVSSAPPPLPGLGVGGSAALLAVGTGHLLWALDLLLRRRTLTIEPSALTVAVRGLTGVRRWREPLANYRGVRHRRERVYRRCGWRVVHRIEIAHPDPDRTVTLLSTRDEVIAEAAARRWSDALGLPVLAADSAARRRAPLEAPRDERCAAMSHASAGDPGRVALVDER